MSKEAVFLWKTVCSLSPSMDLPVTNEHNMIIDKRHKLRQIIPCYVTLADHLCIDWIRRI